jgi:hypothetical protein
MPFGAFHSLGDAILHFQVMELRERFVEPEPLPVNEYFRTELAFTLNTFDVECSEWAVCENLIYPVLRESVKRHADVLGLWSHIPLYKGEELLGVPDYIIGKRSPLSARVVERPFAMIMEAKRNDFDAGWSQCLAAMAAVQDLNGDASRVVYGGVSDGFQWQFAQLRERQFVREPFSYQLQRLDELLGALNNVLGKCREQVLSPATAA